MFIHDRDDPRIVTRVPFTFIRNANRFSNGFACGSNLTLTANNHLIVIGTYYEGMNMLAYIQNLDLNSNEVTSSLNPIVFPYSVEPAIVVVSPNDEKIAWKWFNPSIDISLNWLRKYFHFLPLIKPKNRTEVWISNIDGNDMAEVGHINNTFPGHPPYSLFWSPDSKHLFFNDGDAIWLAPE